jgi:hypothetical protein
MGGFIALYVTACLNLGNPGSCVTEFITDSTQNQMTMTECLGVEGACRCLPDWRMAEHSRSPV